MPDHWPTDAQRAAWDNLADAKAKADEECAELEGKEKLECIATAVKKHASDGGTEI